MSREVHATRVAMQKARWDASKAQKCLVRQAKTKPETELVGSWQRAPLDGGDRYWTRGRKSFSQTVQADALTLASGWTKSKLHGVVPFEWQLWAERLVSLAMVEAVRWAVPGHPEVSTRDWDFCVVKLLQTNLVTPRLPLGFP
jgi:hypothetical protein